MVLTDNAWSGSPCFVIGGGPSLRGFDFDRLKGRGRVIAVNAAFRFVPWADAFYTEDAHTIFELWINEPAWKEFAGLKVIHARSNSVLAQRLRDTHDPKLVLVQAKRKDKFWSESLERDGIGTSSNSSVGAVNLADVLGCNPIYLLGMDCRSAPEDKNKTHFHAEYPDKHPFKIGKGQFDNFRRDWELWVAPHLRRRGRTVVNVVNPECESTVSCFPKRTLAEVFEHFKPAVPVK